MGVNIEQRNRTHDAGGFYPYVYDRRITLDEVMLGRLREQTDRYLVFI
jgi:hypothetical protein